MTISQIDPITELAARAAALIPRMPVDAVNYLAWRELVWETARRLADLAGPEGLRGVPTDRDLDADVEGSLEHLLGLAAVFQRQGRPSDAVLSRPASTSLDPH